MAEEGDVLTNLNPQPGAMPNGEDTAPAVGIITQYVKDMSIENPNAPACFQWSEQPHIDLQFNIAAEKVEGEIHEVELKITVTAKTSQGNLYLVELSYCGLVGARNLPDEHLHAFLYAECPRLLFPFARNAVADAVRHAGFPPLMLDPIDFGLLYQQQLAQRAAQMQAEADAAGQPPAGEA